MSRTFEEMASRELDSLYQGALFLSGGEPWMAEKLLVESMTSSFREHGKVMPEGAVEHWLEGQLAKQFLLGVELGPSQEADTLYAAAAALPPWPRAAVWLVLLRRWSYAEACVALAVDLDVLEDLLRYRDQLMTEILRASPRGNGTDGARM